MPRWLIATLVLLCAALWWAAHRNSAPMAATAAGGAVDACRALQVPASLGEAWQSPQAAPPFRIGDATITPVAGFSVAARVLSREDYHFGRESRYSPTDLALGWGPMSAPGLAGRLQVSQGGRWYRYRWGGEGPPLAPSEIALNSANMHMVPADAAIAARLAMVHAEQAVRIDGWLVNIDGDDGWRWRTSTTRADAGTGACEVVLVCALHFR